MSSVSLSRKQGVGHGLESGHSPPHYELQGFFWDNEYSDCIFIISHWLLYSLPTPQDSILFVTCEIFMYCVVAKWKAVTAPSIYAGKRNEEIWRTGVEKNGGPTQVSFTCSASWLKNYIYAYIGK